MLFRHVGRLLMNPWRLLTHDGAGAADGLALDESLMGPYRDRDAAPTLRLYTYRSHCALIGRFQDATAELNLDECARTGTEVNRRPTGGGAILMGADQLGVAVVTHLRRDETPPHARAIVMEFGRGVALGLARLGITGEVRGKNDIAVDRRKIAGLGVYIDEGDSVLFHASILVDLDVALMLRLLNIPAAKLGDKGITSVQERVTTIHRETNSAISLDDVRACVAGGFEEAFGIRCEPDSLTETERDDAERVAQARYRDPAWVMLRSGGEAPEGTSLLKTPGGLLRIGVMLDGDAIKSALLTGDFMATDRALVELEAALRWAPADRDRVALAVAHATTAGGGLSGVSEDDLVQAIWHAVTDARARRGMTTGSCYYPPVSSPAIDAVVSGRQG